MNFPSLATDSFYKFLTILGLVLVVFSSKILSDRFVSNRDNEINYIHDSLILAKEIKNLEIDKEFFQSRMDSSISNNLFNLNQQDSINITRIKLAKLDNEIVLKKELMLLSKEKTKDSDSYLKFITRVATLLWILGLGGLLWGFQHWYEKQQKTKDKELLRDYINIGKISMFCNSCGTRMNKDTIRPKEKDGSINYRYCRDCYHNGEFVESDLTLEMTKDRIIENSKYKFIAKWKLYCIDNMERWRKIKLPPTSHHQ